MIPSHEMGNRSTFSINLSPRGNFKFKLPGVREFMSRARNRDQRKTFKILICRGKLKIYDSYSSQEHTDISMLAIVCEQTS